MKKLFLLSLLFVGALTFGQTKPKTNDIDKNANVVLDSLSKVYHVKVGSIVIIECNGVKTTSITYVKNGELLKKVIKTELVK
jgi:hypothetical protein